MSFLSTLDAQEVTPAQRMWVEGLAIDHLGYLAVYSAGRTVCPPVLVAEINKHCPSGKVSIEIKKLAIAVKSRKSRGEIIPSIRREEFVAPKGGSIEYGVNSVKVCLPGVKPEEFIASPLPTTLNNPDPDVIRLAAVIGQFADIKKGVLCNPINKEAVDHYSGIEGVVDGQRTNMVPTFLEKTLESSPDFNSVIANEGTLQGEAFLEKLVNFLHAVPSDVRNYLTWQISTSVLRLAAIDTRTGKLYYHTDFAGNSLYKGSLVPIKKDTLPPADQVLWQQFKDIFKYAPVKIGKVQPKVKLSAPTDESYRKAIKGCAAAVGVSRGLGGVIANMDYCSGQSDQIRKACWYKAMIKSCRLKMEDCDIKCSTGVATLLLSQLKDEIGAGLRLWVSDSIGKVGINSAIISQRRSGSHVFYYSDLQIPSTPKVYKQEEDVEAYHKQTMETLLEGLSDTFISGYTLFIPASHACIFDDKHHVYATKNNSDGSVIYSTIELIFSDPVVTHPYDLPKDKTYDRTLASVIFPVTSWVKLKEHTLVAIKHALTFFMNPVYSCTPLGRIFVLNGTTEYQVIESELVYVGRKLDEGVKRPGKEEIFFDDPEDVLDALRVGGIGVPSHFQFQQQQQLVEQPPITEPAPALQHPIQPVTVSVKPNIPEEIDFDLNEDD